MLGPRPPWDEGVVDPEKQARITRVKQYEHTYGDPLENWAAHVPPFKFTNSSEAIEYDLLRAYLRIEISGP